MPTDPQEVAVLFWASFATTLVLLVVAIVAALRRKRKIHLVAGPLAIVSLAITVVFTERLVKTREFPPEELGIHLWFAKSGGVLALLVAISGVLLAFQPRLRKVHRVFVVLFLLVTLVATGTGIWVFQLSSPK